MPWCNQCEKELPLAHFYKSEGVPIKPCKVCRKEKQDKKMKDPAYRKLMVARSTRYNKREAERERKSRERVAVEA